MKNKIIDAKTCQSLFHDGQTIAVGGFLAKGGSETVIDALMASGAKDLTILCNDGGTCTKKDKETGKVLAGPTGVGKLIEAGRVKRLVATHIGLNPQVGQKMNAGELEVTLIPQGTFAECLRAAGSGLGGVITPTGVGTIIEDDKVQTYQSIELDGKKYIIAKPLHPDVAIIHGEIVDEFGNVYYEKTARNFNPLCALAAKTVICGANKVVKNGELNGSNVVTPGVLVHYIMKEEQ